MARGGFKKMVEDMTALSSGNGGATPTRDPPGTPGPSQDSSSSDQADPTTTASTSGAPDELELIEETWPGKVCAFCNLGERSQLGQGEMLRLEVGQDFEAVRQNPANSQERLASLAANAGVKGAAAAAASAASSAGGKKPRLTIKGRRSSSFDAAQFCSELQEELNAVGYADEPDLLGIVEPCGYFYAHRTCATWSKGVTVSDGLGSLEVTGVDAALIRAASLRCHLCGSFGASLSCQAGGAPCPKSYHFPCAVSCG